MTKPQPMRPCGACAIAAATGRIPERVFLEPVSPRIRVWRVSTARGTSPSGGGRVRHCGTVNAVGPAEAVSLAGAGPIWSTRRNTYARAAEMGVSISKSRR